MKNKIIPGLALILLMVTKVFAVSVSDIPTIMNVSAEILTDAANLRRLAAQLQELSDNGFVVALAYSTQTVSIPAGTRQGLIAKYQDLKSQLQADIQALP